MIVGRAGHEYHPHQRRHAIVESRAHRRRNDSRQFPLATPPIAGAEVHSLDLDVCIGENRLRKSDRRSGFRGEATRRRQTDGTRRGHERRAERRMAAHDGVERLDERRTVEAPFDMESDERIRLAALDRLERAGEFDTKTIFLRNRRGSDERVAVETRRSRECPRHIGVMLRGRPASRVVEHGSDGMRISMDLGLAERVVVITGSSQGIGAATAESFGREGAHVAVTYRSNREKADAVVNRIRNAGGDAFACQLELASFDSIRSAVDTVRERWGRIDILVNNAMDWGARTLGAALPFDQLPSSEWQPLLRINIEGTYAVIQAALPAMKERQWGRILNVSSTVASDGAAGSGWYSMAKAALHGLTRSLSHELDPFGILINAVLPGPTLTERVAAQSRAARGGASVPAAPRRRLLAPNDTASIIVFLCSAANTGVTGALIPVTGGIPTPTNPLLLDAMQRRTLG